MGKKANRPVGRPKNPEPPKPTVVVYVEVEPYIKEQLEALAKLHNRKLTGEVLTAFQEYLAKFNRWPKPE